MMLERLAKTAVLFAMTTATAAMLSVAVALPLPQSAAAPAMIEAAVEAPVELAHGCHRGVLRDNRGWHFHSGACARRSAPPPGLYDMPSNRRFYRGPICSYQCRHVGPVKTCQQVCR